LYISRDVVFDESVFPFSQLPVSPSNSINHSTPNIGQFDDVAHTSLLLPNHDAGKIRGARLELLPDEDGTPDIDQGYSDRLHAYSGEPRHAGSDPPLR
jgi:hypothetical protein